MKAKIISLLALLPMCGHIWAQRPAGADTVLKGSTIEVLQTYKPKVKQSPKPEWKPQLPPVDTSRPAFNFDVPQQTLYYSYNSPPLRPLALGKLNNEQPYPNYVKVGGGNLSTIYLDAGIGALHGDNYETAFELHHLSQKGSITNQQSALSGISADGTLHNSIGDLHGNVDVSRNQYNYYGYNHTLYNYEQGDVKQTYTTAALSADLASRADTANPLSYHPSIGAYYLSSRNSTSEVNVNFDAPVRYALTDDLGVGLRLAGAVTGYKADTISTSNNYLIAQPGLDYTLQGYTAKAYAGIALGHGGQSYFLPDLSVAFNMPDYLFHIGIGYRASLIQNSYRQLTTENPYMRSDYVVNQSLRNEIYGEIRGALGDHFSYSGQASYWHYNTLPSFLNDTGDQKEFYVIYQQDISVLGFQAGLRYHMGNKWSAGITGEHYTYTTHTADPVWHQPATKLRADFTISPIEKLDISAAFYLMGGIHARDTLYNTITLKPVADLSLYAEYQIINRLSAFVQVSNILNNKYQRWYGYNAYGFNIYGGIRLKF